VFDATRAVKEHLSFGYGVYPLTSGLPLARLEARSRCPRCSERFPDLALAVPAERLEPAGHLHHEREAGAAGPYWCR